MGLDIVRLSDCYCVSPQLLAIQSVYSRRGGQKGDLSDMVAVSRAKHVSRHRRWIYLLHIRDTYKRPKKKAKKKKQLKNSSDALTKWPLQANSTYHYPAAKPKPAGQSNTQS